MTDAAGESEGREALHLLESCADAVLRTDDGTDIPCCRYNILKTCSILKDLVDNFALDTDAAGRCILPVPNTHPAKLRLAMKLVHGVQAIDSLSLEEVALARDGLALLGCSALDETLLDRLSNCLENASDPALIKEHLQKLLHSEQHRQTALTRLVVLCPLWTEFKDMFLAMPMTVDLARFALKSLVKFYPADLVFEALLNSLPTHGLTPTHCFELFGDIGTGVYFHPEDVRATLDALTDMFEYKGWVNKSELIATSSAFAFLPTNTAAETQAWDPFFKMVRGLASGLQNYDVAPYNASSFHGSVISFQTCPYASCNMSIEAELPRHKVLRRRKVCEWLTLTLDRVEGTVDIILNLWKVDSQASRAREVQVRVTATAGEVDRPAVGPAMVGEAWYTFTGVIPRLGLTLAACDMTFGTHDTLRSTLQSSSLDRVRVDVWYGTTSILERPFY